MVISPDVIYPLIAIYQEPVPSQKKLGAEQNAFANEASLWQKKRARLAGGSMKMKVWPIKSTSLFPARLFSNS